MLKKRIVYILRIATLMIIIIVTGLIAMNPVKLENVPVFDEISLVTNRDVVHWPTADGTFIQWWLVKDWDDVKWAKEFEVLKEAGMSYLVLTPTAFYEEDKVSKAGRMKTIYPTNLPGVELMKDYDGTNYPDVVALCLKNAQNAGIKVFLGLNSSEEWWSKRHDTQWIYQRMNEGNQIADELWNRYYQQYPDAFYGWYWCWEVDNFFFKRHDFFNSVGILTHAIKIQTQYLEQTNKRLPILLSPYMNRMLGTPKGYASMWEYVFANSGLKEGDIFCPQDCIGAGGLEMGNLPTWFSELRKAVDTLPGLQFWANTEIFNISDWTAAPVNRFVEQMKLLVPYVDNYLTFAYSHYYSPNLVNPGFHRMYMAYKTTGTVDAKPPVPPLMVKAVREEDGSIRVSWSAASKNADICGYYVYRNGKKVAHLQVPRGEMGTQSDVLSTEYLDRQPPLLQNITYEVAAYDFAGNVSERAKSGGL